MLVRLTDFATNHWNVNPCAEQVEVECLVISTEQPTGSCEDYGTWVLALHMQTATLKTMFIRQGHEHHVLSQ